MAYNMNPCLVCGTRAPEGTLVCADHAKFAAKTNTVALKGGGWVRDASGVMRWVK